VSCELSYIRILYFTLLYFNYGAKCELLLLLLLLLAIILTASFTVIDAD